MKKIILILITTWLAYVVSNDINLNNYSIDSLNEIISNMSSNTKFLLQNNNRMQNIMDTEDVLYLYEHPHIDNFESFDFIIVGSGSAGTAIANRLSEIDEWKILLLELGEEANSLTDIPVLAVTLQFSKYNWNYLMEKQENMCLGMEEQRMRWPRGRALGGSSIINYMIHVRGNPKDYDLWAAMGNPGWSYREVLPYFVKLENSLIERSDREYRGYQGNLPVSDVPYKSGSLSAYMTASLEAGHPYVDYNGKTQLGVSYVQSTTKQGRRWSGEKAYLRPVRQRKNLKILTKARVVKVLIDPKTKIAYGVKYVKDQKYRIARAKKEVILSAGAFNSPQLLMLSGVGPKNHLRELGIKVLQDLPVGQKMYDHLTFVGLIFTINSTSVLKFSEILSVPEVLKYLLRGDGSWSSLGGVEALTYIQTNVSEEQPGYPDMELIYLGGGLHTDEGNFHRRCFGIKNEIYDKIWKPLEKKLAFQVFPMLVHPKSYGYLKLKSRNPFHWPKFYGNFFTDPEDQDIRTFIASIREVQRIVSMPAMQRIGAKLLPIPIPGCERHQFDSDSYWECALRHLSSTLHHQVTTCKMGPSNDPEAVVDSRLKVYGIRNLRVADTSIIPLPLTAHTNVPAYMVGEKASDLIKEDWLRNYNNQL